MAFPFRPANAEIQSLLDAAYQRQLIEQFRAEPTSVDLAQRTGSIASLFPWMKPGVALSLGQSGYTSDSPEVKIVAEAAAQSKRKRGFGWHSVGDVVSSAYGGAVSGVKSVVRGAATDLSFGYEALQGAVREAYQGASSIAQGDFGSAEGYTSVAGWTDPLERTVGQTQLAISTESALTGGKYDAGQGFLPGGEQRAEQVRRARAQGMIDGHAITPGRIVAHAFTEPGSGPYKILSGLVDASAAIALDPSAKALKGAGQVRRTNKTFNASKPLPTMVAGGIDGVRQTTISDNVDAWLDSTDGRRVIDYTTGEMDFQNLWTRTNKKLPVKLAAALADARDPDTVRELLRSELGISVREKPALGGFGVKVRDVTSKHRTWTMVPGSKLPVNDPDEAVETLDRFQRNAKMPAEVIAANNGRLARANTPAEVFDVVTDTMGQTFEHIKGVRVGKSTSSRMTQMYRDYHADLRKYATDEIGNNMPLPWVGVDGAGLPLPSPHMWSELLNTAMPMPDAREIRRATSKLAPLFEHKVGKSALDGGTALADFVTQSIFKPAMLALRPAWTVRVIGEEQARMASVGMTNMYTHPLSHIAWATGRKGGVGATGDDLAEVDQRAEAMSRGSGGFRDKLDVIRTPADVTFERVQRDEYVPAWADEITDLSNDPVAKRVAQGVGSPVRVGGEDVADDAHLETASDWFWTGPGKKFRKELAGARGLEDLATSRGAADEYLDTILDRIRIKTGRHPALIDAIATGKHGEVPLFTRGSDRTTHAKFVESLNPLFDEGVGPARVKGNYMVHSKGSTAEHFVQRYDRAVETLFNTLMSRPTNFLSRSPAFNQFYWQRITEMASEIDPRDATRLLKNARIANLDKEALAKLEQARGGTGSLRLTHADLVAKGWALDSTRKHLYDLSERSQFGDITRNIYPFFEAWKEILATWARIGTQNPQIPRRAQQIIEGARGSGAFYSDPQTGEEKFIYPGSEWVTRQAIGVPVKFEGSVQGLNLFSTGLLPGFGPVVQYPAAKLLPDTPEFDGIRDKILPYGSPDTGGGLLESFAPSWIQKVRTAWGIHPSPEQQRMFANTVMDVQRSLLTTGKYDINTEAGQNELHQDSVTRARILYTMRAVLQSTAPSSPSAEFMAKTKDGEWAVAEVLVQDYQKMTRDMDYDKATSAFLEKYGPHAVLYMQGKTRTLVPGIEPTREAFTWVRRNKDVTERFPLVYGFFAPSGGDFDYSAYRSQIERGERETIDPKAALRMANARVGNLLYAQAKEKVGDKPSPSDRDWLRTVRSAIVKEYPGFDAAYGGTKTADTKTLLAQLREAVEDKRLAGTPQGKATSMYFQARDKATEAAQARGYQGFDRSSKTKDIRDWLAAIGEQLSINTPEFAPVWERLLSREVD